MKIGEKNYLKIEVTFKDETIVVFTDKDLKLAQGASIDYTPALMPKYDQKEVIRLALDSLRRKVSLLSYSEENFAEISRLLKLRDTLVEELEELSDNGKT